MAKTVDLGAAAKAITEIAQKAAESPEELAARIDRDSRELRIKEVGTYLLYSLSGAMFLACLFLVVWGHADKAIVDWAKTGLFTVLAFIAGLAVAKR